ANLMIGSNYLGSAPYFNGSIDDFLIFNKSLTADEVLGLYNATRVSHSESVTPGNVTYTAYTQDLAGNVGSDVKVFGAVNLSRSDFTGGDSTNLTNVDLRNITNLTFDNPAQGKIVFSENVSFVDVGDVNEHVNISFNRIEVNSTGLPALNKSATLYLYNLTFSNPRILRDGAVCSTVICSEVDYTGGTLEFTVSEFSVYTTEETPATTATVASSSGGGGGGGGGSVPAKLSGVEVDPAEFNIKKVVGIFDKREVTLSNTGEEELEIMPLLVGLEGIVGFDNNNFTIAAGKSEVFEFDVNVPEEVGIYVGKLVFKAGDKILEVPFVLNANPEKSLFDIGVDIPDEYKRIDEGEKLKVQITLLQAALQEQMDVTLDYVIKDYDGGVYLRESETVAVFAQKSFTKEFQVHEFPEGKYIIGATVTYPDGSAELVATASSQFDINQEFFSVNLDYVVIAILVAVILIFVFLVILITKYKREIHRHRTKKGGNKKGKKNGK
ncbi:hypothetical protein HOA55_01085, partial [archaeon]|nr:hypothetical protein [archaeon]